MGTPAFFVSTIHDRMPLILPVSEYGVWLDAQVQDASVSELLVPYPADDMQAVRVSDVVNNARNEVDPRLT